MIWAWLRGILQLLLVLCILAALWELRGAWQYSIGPALGRVALPLRVQTEILTSVGHANDIREFRRSRYGSTGYVASASFRDPEGRLRIVHSEGLFVQPSRGDPVEVAYYPAILAGAEPGPRSPNAPVEAEGSLLSIDILYGRALMYAGLAVVIVVLLAGTSFFRVPMGAALARLERGSRPQESAVQRGVPLEEMSRSGASAADLERSEQRRQAGAALGDELREVVRGMRERDESER